jgi:predicted CopG family antitoxin
MRNVTVTVSDDIYRRARVWAAERDTSISEVVRYLLETLQGIPRAGRAFPAPNPADFNTDTGATKQK